MKLRLCSTRITTSLQVLLAAVKVQQLAIVPRVEADGQGVDGKVAPVQVGLDGAALHLGQGRRVGIELHAGRWPESREETPNSALAALQDDLGRAKALRGCACAPRPAAPRRRASLMASPSTTRSMSSVGSPSSRSRTKPPTMYSGIAHLLGQLAGLVQQVEQRGRQRSLDLLHDLVAARRFEQGAAQSLIRSVRVTTPITSPSRTTGTCPTPRLGHDLLQALDRVVGLTWISPLVM